MIASRPLILSRAEMSHQPGSTAHIIYSRLSCQTHLNQCQTCSLLRPIVKSNHFLYIYTITKQCGLPQYYIRPLCYRDPSENNKLVLLTKWSIIVHAKNIPNRVTGLLASKLSCCKMFLRLILVILTLPASFCSCPNFFDVSLTTT